ncbi:hypothetical protein GUA87_14485 [Sneathiella sp. P13V-1]|uniref:SEL1-like repeat protein n=1 Tax=Sneathiella sp. P13V-1 TaxID=2697366 RepID=UPI00187B6524|nr:SEL1-like repeat protein [Sneathiella sp. P13V-1]MBE7638061.1 hypothetical protein [Sneathiella sp. P13V-1]
MKRFGLMLGALVLMGNTAHASFEKGLAAYQQEDFGTAVSLWSKEGAEGHLDAQYNLGVIFEKGVPGVKKDLPEAFAWFRLAASQNVVAAEQALSRIKPLMTSVQLEEGNKRAIELLGKWYRTNIGLDDVRYKQILAQREQQIEARKKAEEQAAKARANQQRALLAQRDAAAKREERVKEQSRQAAILAAQRAAEQAKQQRVADDAARAEKERLANEQAERERQLKLAAAKLRLQQLKSKQQASGGPSIASTSLAPVTATPVETTAPAATTAVTKPVASVAPAAQPVPQPATPPKTVAQPSATSQQLQPAASTPKPVAEPKTVAKAVEAPKTRMPVISRGMDAKVVKEIISTANSVPLDNAAAKAEIAQANTEISALKWSLISAARGKASARGMNAILTKNMTQAQIAEANRQAAEWIMKRQARN